MVETDQYKNYAERVHRQCTSEAAKLDFGRITGTAQSEWKTELVRMNQNQELMCRQVTDEATALTAILRQQDDKIDRLQTMMEQQHDKIGKLENMMERILAVAVSNGKDTQQQQLLLSQVSMAVSPQPSRRSATTSPSPPSSSSSSSSPSSSSSASSSASSAAARPTVPRHGVQPLNDLSSTELRALLGGLVLPNWKSNIPGRPSRSARHIYRAWFVDKRRHGSTLMVEATIGDVVAVGYRMGIIRSLENSQTLGRFQWAAEHFRDLLAVERNGCTRAASPEDLEALADAQLQNTCIDLLASTEKPPSLTANATLSAFVRFFKTIPGKKYLEQLGS